jgi:hypothetical protein
VISLESIRKQLKREELKLKIIKKRLTAVLLCFLLLFGIAYAALAEEMPLMPMAILGEVVDQNGSSMTAGDLKVFIGDKPVILVDIVKGQVDFSLDATNKDNLSVIDRDDIGKTISFKAEINNKEYNAAAAKEIIFVELANEDLLITVDYTSGSSGSSSSGGQSAAKAPVSPIASPAAGTYAESVKVELSCSTAQAVIYYTNDNTDPKSSNTRNEYKEPVNIDKDTIIKAVSSKTNIFSEVAVFDYKIGQTVQPNGSTGGNPTVVLSDIQGHWAEAIIDKMVGQGVISGYEDKTFRPNNLISRAECAAVIDRALALESGASQDMAGFSDASDIPEWAGDSVAAAVYAGLLKGYPGAEGKTVFLPQKQITRVELAAIIARVLTSKSVQTTSQKAQFTDSSEIPEWATGAVDLAVQKGIITGYPDGTFKPQKNVTRSEAAAMIDRLLDSVK